MGNLVFWAVQHQHELLLEVELWAGYLICVFPPKMVIESKANINWHQNWYPVEGTDAGSTEGCFGQSQPQVSEPRRMFLKSKHQNNSNVWKLWKPKPRMVSMTMFYQWNRPMGCWPPPGPWRPRRARPAVHPPRWLGAPTAGPMAPCPAGLPKATEATWRWHLLRSKSPQSILGKNVKILQSISKYLHFRSANVNF